MQRRNMPNGRILRIDRNNNTAVSLPPFAAMFGDYANDRPAWWIRAGIWIGLLMPDNSQKGWSLNPSVVTLLILIASLIGGGGYYLGQQDKTIQNIERQATEAQRAANIAVSTVSSYEPSPTPKKEKR